MYRLNDCEVVADVNDVNYTFPDVDQITVDDPRTKTLIRGINGKNKEGFITDQNTDQPVVITTTLKGLDENTANVFIKAFKNDTRFNFNVIKSADGKKCCGKKCILNQMPIQRTFGVDAESYSLDLIMHTFNYSQD